MAAQAAAASKNASLPMVQQNQCPFSLLAHSVPFSIPGMKVLNINDDLFWFGPPGYISTYMDAMGKKMDKMDEMKDI